MLEQKEVIYVNNAYRFKLFQYSDHVSEKWKMNFTNIFRSVKAGYVTFHIPFSISRRLLLT